MTPPSNGAFASEHDRTQSHATFHRERPFAHPHLRVSETTEARQQGAGRHLHQGGCDGEGLCAGQLDRRGDGKGHGLYRRRQRGAAAPRQVAPPRWDIPRLRPPRRRPSSVVKTTSPRAVRAPAKIPVLPSRPEKPPAVKKKAGRGAVAGRPQRRSRGRKRPAGPEEKERERDRTPAIKLAPLPTSASRRCGENRRSRPRRSPTSGSPKTPSAPAKRAPSRFPSTSASTSSGGLPPKPPRPRRTSKRLPRRRRPERRRRVAGSVPAAVHAVSSLCAKRRGRRPPWAAASSGN